MHGLQIWFICGFPVQNFQQHIRTQNCFEQSPPPPPGLQQKNRGSMSFQVILSLMLFY